MKLTYLLAISFAAFGLATCLETTDPQTTNNEVNQLYETGVPPGSEEKMVQVEVKSEKTSDTEVKSVRGEVETEPTPFWMMPSEILSPLAPLDGTTFYVCVFSTFYVAMHFMKRKHLDVYTTLNGATMVFASLMTLYDLARGYSAKHLNYPKASTVVFLIGRALFLTIYGLHVLGAPMRYGTKLPIAVYWSISAALTLIYSLQLFRNDRTKNNTPFYVYGAMPLLMDVTLRALEARAESKPTILDPMASKLDDWQASKGFMKVLLDAGAAGLWFFYVFAMTPLRKHVLLDSPYTTAFQVFWIGLTVLLLLPLAMTSTRFPVAINQLAAVYFDTLPLQFIVSHLAFLGDFWQRHHSKFIIAAGVLLTALPVLSFTYPYWKPLLVHMPDWVSVPVHREFYYVLQLVDAVLTTSTLKLMIALFGYLIGFIVIYDVIFKKTFLETSYNVYSEVKGVTREVKDEWSSTLKSAIATEFPKERKLFKKGKL